MPTGEPARPWLPRWLLALAGIGLVGYGIYLLRGVLTPLLIAVLLAYLLDPVVDRLERWRIPRGPAIAVLLGAFLLTLTAMTLLVVPRAVRESVDFFRQLPRRFDATWQQVEPWLVAQGVVVPTSFKELQAQLGDHVGDFSQRAAVAV
ncbi:MAG TPA: AI-2E family transporter, partial [Polyangiaceae bacterium]|nr:AI-2E family transporter [Polyangiaceae bacterium]